MITLITGVPGSGKTALAVSMLLDVRGRPVFVQGIPDLSVPHERTPPVSEWTVRVPSPDDPALEIPVFTFPSGSLVVIDEAQNVFRPRGVGSKVPDIVAAFEAHRHLGIDFWLITQSPTLIDSNIRKLVSKHIHVRSTYLGRVLHEAPQVFDPDSRSERALTSSRKYVLPKRAFGAYRSAEMHTKAKVRPPRAVYILVVALLVAVGLGWHFFGRVSDFVDPASVAHVESGPAQQGRSGMGAVGFGTIVSPSSVPSSLVHALRPSDPANPLSAPLFSSVAPAPVPPEIVGCVSSSVGCVCYTQQSTRLWVPEDQCRLRVAGFYYDPYVDVAKRARDVGVGRGHASAGVDPVVSGGVGGSGRPYSVVSDELPFVDDSAVQAPQ